MFSRVFCRNTEESQTPVALQVQMILLAPLRLSRLVARDIMKL